MKLTTTQRSVIIALYLGGAQCDGERLMTYKSLGVETKKNHRALKGAITGLRFQGLVVHSPAINDDGQPCGSGFMLTLSGNDLAETYEELKDEI